MATVIGFANDANVLSAATTPFRKAVCGVWVAEVQPRPISWDEVLSRAQRPSFDVALAAAKLRFLARS